MRRFARRGLRQAAVELALAATAYNLTRLWRTRQRPRKRRSETGVEIQWRHSHIKIPGHRVLTQTL
jgi:hypothetical protein